MKHISLAFFCILFGLKIYSQTARTIQHSIKSEYFEEERIIQVHLPKAFQNTERLPVIYVFDAQWDTYFELSTSIVDYLIETREFPRSIVVGIHSNKRQHEFTPKPVNEDWKIPSLGGAKLLEGYLTDDVIPFIKDKYNAESFNIGIGHSLGGTFVLNSIVDNPSLFNAYIAFSPNLQIDEEEITLKLQRNLSKIKQSNTFIYTTIGTEENPETMFLPYAKRLDTIMSPYNSSNFNWNFEVLEGFNHATTPLESIHRGLLKLSEKWKMTETQKQDIANNEDVLAAFNRFYKNLSNWLGYMETASKNEYYNFAGFLEAKEKYNDAISIYKSAIEQFSSESRFYNNIAESLIKLKKHSEAKAYIQKALKILETETFDYPGDKPYFEALYQKNLEKINTPE